MTESVLVNGVSLDTYAVMLRDSSGLMITPDIQEGDIEVAGRHGALLAPTRRYATGRIVLRLWVAGALPDGSIPPGSNERREFFARRDELIRLFHARPVNVDYTPDLGVVPYRRAVCELDEALSFTRIGARADAAVNVALRIPEAFWADLAATTASATVATGGTLNLSAFAGANAPIGDGVITFGAGNNPTLIQGSTFVAYDGVISAGRQLTLDCSDWSVGTGSGTAWTPDHSKIRYSPGPGWFEFDPTGVLSAQLTHTGGGSMFVSYTARKRYLTG